MKWFSASLIILCSAAALSAAEVPELKGTVNDYADVIDDAKEKELTDFLLAQEKESSNQIVILTINTLDGEAIEEYGRKVARTWKLGQEDKDNGILVVAAIQDRKMRIEVGRGLEGVLPDAMCGRIIRNEMAPKFRQQDFAGGFTAAAIGIDKAVKGEFVAGEGNGQQNAGGQAFLIVLVILFTIVGIVALLAWFLASKTSSTSYTPLPPGTPSRRSSGSSRKSSESSRRSSSDDDSSFLGGALGGGMLDSDSSSSSSSGSDDSFGGGYSGGGGSFGGGGASGSW